MAPFVIFEEDAVLDLMTEFLAAFEQGLHEDKQQRRERRQRKKRYAARLADNNDYGLSLITDEEAAR